jgi:hypothetical protein
MPITSLTDGDVNTAWSSTALASAETSQQVTLDLGANQSFNRVVLYPRWDTDGDAVRCFPISFQLNGSTDADGWTKLAEYANFAPPALNVGVSLPVTLPPDTYYRYLQLQISQESADQFGTYYVQLAEIEVYQGCWTLTVAGQSSFVAPNVPTNLTNTNLDTYWSSVKLASDSCNEWVLLHCSYPRMPLRLVLHPRWASPGSEQPARALCFPVAFTVQGSIGDGNWDILATFTDFPTPVFNAGVSLPLTLSNLYQYLRLNVTQTGSDGSAANQYFEVPWV